MGAWYGRALAVDFVVARRLLWVSRDCQLGLLSILRTNFFAVTDPRMDAHTFASAPPPTAPVELTIIGGKRTVLARVKHTVLELPRVGFDTCLVRQDSAVGTEVFKSFTCDREPPHGKKLYFALEAEYIYGSLVLSTPSYFSPAKLNIYVKSRPFNTVEKEKET